MYPPTVAEASVKMHYPPGIPEENQLAIGQEVFGLLPGLSLFATLWLREHNRVCDVLKEEHPTWDDEQLFQTARLVIIGEADRGFNCWGNKASPLSLVCFQLVQLIGGNGC